MTYPNTKVDALINDHISRDGTWTPKDFAALAVAAADQAGASVEAQDKIAALLPACATCCEPAHGLCVLPCVYCDKPSVTATGESRCEACAAEFARAAARQERQDAWEARGDALRDERKGER